MTKQEIKDSILKVGWAKTFDSLKTQEDRKLFVEVLNEYQKQEKEYLPFGVLEA